MSFGNYIKTTYVNNQEPAINDTHLNNTENKVYEIDHAITSSATASSIVGRDASGRAQFADPSAAQDAATKNFVSTNYAPLASPAFTGTPTAPTATAGTNTTQVATTAFVQTALGSYSKVAQGSYSGTGTSTTGTITAGFQPKILILQATGYVYMKLNTVTVLLSSTTTPNDFITLTSTGATLASSDATTGAFGNNGWNKSGITVYWTAIG